jgi:hypothetical protein
MNNNWKRWRIAGRLSSNAGGLAQTQITLYSSDQGAISQHATLKLCVHRFSCIVRHPSSKPALAVIMTHTIGLAIASNPAPISNKALILGSAYRLVTIVSASSPSPPRCLRLSEFETKSDCKRVINVLSIRPGKLRHSLVIGVCHPHDYVLVSSLSHARMGLPGVCSIRIAYNSVSTSSSRSQYISYDIKSLRTSTPSFSFMNSDKKALSSFPSTSPVVQLIRSA